MVAKGAIFASFEVIERDMVTVEFELELKSTGVDALRASIDV